MRPTIQEVRRANLRRIIEQRGGMSSTAKMLGLVGPSHLSQILSGHRPFNEKSARKFELKLGLAERTLDQREGEPLPFAGTDRATLADSVRVVGEELERAKVKLAPERFARLVALVYEASVHAGSVDRANVSKLIELMF